MMPGETVASGAQLDRCEWCHETPTLRVCRSAAGYYVGYQCCLPFSRESGYYPTQEAAAAALASGDFGRAPQAVPGKGVAW